MKRCRKCHRSPENLKTRPNSSVGHRSQGLKTWSKRYSIKNQSHKTSLCTIHHTMFDILSSLPSTWSLRTKSFISHRRPTCKFLIPHPLLPFPVTNHMHHTNNSPRHIPMRNHSN